MMERTGQERRRGRERLGSSEGEQRRGGLKVQCATFIYEIFLVQWKHTLSKYTSSVQRTVTLSVLSLEVTFTLEAAILGQPCFFWPFWKNHYGPFEIVIIKQWQTTLCWHWLPCSYWFSVRQVSCPICLFVSNHFCPVCGQLFSQCLLLLLLVFYDVLLQGPLQFFAGFCHLVVRFCCTLVCVLSFWWSCLCFLVSFVLIFAVGLLGFVCLFYFALKRSVLGSAHLRCTIIST